MRLARGDVAQSQCSERGELTIDVSFPVNDLQG